MLRRGQSNRTSVVMPVQRPECLVVVGPARGPSLSGEYRGFVWPLPVQKHL